MKIRPILRTSFTIVALASALALGGCSADATSGDDGETQSSEVQGRLSAQELAATKARLRAICNPNMTRTDNADAVRAEVDPLVEKLAKHFGKRTAAQKLPLVAGAWRQIWSDFPYPMAPFVTMDFAQIYQVVSADGHYWNIGDSRAFGFIGITGVLRGRYDLDGSRLNIEFTNSGFRFGRLKAGVDLVAYANDLEDGDKTYLGLPGGGPVGISGALETLYVDGDLRIERGSQNDVLNDDGTVKRAGFDAKLFILDRVQTPAK
jgi:hypothetical protein